VTQFGLSAFIWRDGPGGGGGGGYEARTFNFHLFPAPRGDFDLRFMSQASSLAFLASQGFDFNKASARARRAAPGL
jgi:poly(A)-specific ribonuclease